MSAETTKRKLVEAAYQTLQEEGFEHIKARNVAGKAGYAATAIYKHFGSQIKEGRGMVPEPLRIQLKIFRHSFLKNILEILSPPCLPQCAGV